jgi:pimeloyl-ACP methyl ester carboxylesterase
MGRSSICGIVGRVGVGYRPDVFRRLLLAALAALAVASPAQAFSKQDLTIRMSDGVDIAATLYLPDGARPAGGWPAVMLFHGNGESRTKLNAVGISMNDNAERFLAPFGYAVLTHDLRGHGESGGMYTLNGPRAVQDTRELFDWMRARGDVDDAKIGGFGYSLGGGLMLRAAAEGVPFAALEPAITWSDLPRALLPGNVSKSGAIVGFLNSVSARLDPSLAALKNDLILSRNMPALRSELGSRSTRGRLALSTPTLVMQGRRDFVFGVDEGLTTYAQLRGPKRLYLADFGHPPAAKPAAEIPYALTLGRRWFDRYLRGLPNGIDAEKPVEVAHDPWDGRTTSYAALPPTTIRSAATSFRTPRRLVGGGRLVVPLGKPLTRAAETFGAPAVTVRGTRSGGWSRIVAVLTAGRTVVASGATATRDGSAPVAIRLNSQVTPVPKGARLRLTLSTTSTAQDPGNLLYLEAPPLPQRAGFAVRSVSLALPLLRTRASQ